MKANKVVNSSFDTYFIDDKYSPSKYHVISYNLFGICLKFTINEKV